MSEFNASRHQDVLRVVRQVRGRWRARIAVRGLAIVLGATLIVFGLSVFGLEKLRFTPQAVVTFRVTLWLLLLVLTGRYVVGPLARRVSTEQAALYLEEHEPSLEASIVSALEAGRQARDGHAASNAMVGKLVEQALKRAREVEFGRRIERQGMYRASGALVAVATIAILFTLFGPVQLKHGALALLNPVSDASAVNPYSVEALPGDITIARGSDQMVSAGLRGFESGEAQVFVRGESQESFDRISMLPGVDAGFEILLLAIDEKTEYFIESEGIRSSVYTIDVADLPYVEQIELEYHFPAYTGLAPRTVENGGDIAALRGTRVDLRVTPTMLTPGGQILIGGTPIELQDAGDGTWTGSLTVQDRGFYEIELARKDGELVSASPQYTIDVLADQPPSVSFSKPGRDFAATPVEEVFLEVKADDDFGIGEVLLIYSANGEPEDTVPLFEAVGSPLAAVTAGYTVYLEDFEFEPGDVVSYYAVARDNRRGTERSWATSDIYFIKLRAFRIDFRESQQVGGGPQGTSAQQEPEDALSKLQKDVIAATFNLERNRDFSTEDDYRENVVSVQLAQGRVREQVEALHERMVGRGLAQAEPQFKAIAEMLPEAIAEMEKAEAALQAMRPKEALSPEQRALSRLQKAEETYERIVSTGGQQQSGGGGGANADDLADLFELELDKLKNQYETVQRGERQEQSQQLDETMEKLKELARRQQQEAERARRRAATRQRGGGGASQSQRDLADDTETTARELERLSRETNDPQLQEISRQLQEAADAMRQSAASSGSQGLAQAGSALDRLEEAQRRLKRDQQARLEEDIQDAQQRADDLALEQDKIGRDMQRLGEQSNPSELGRRLMERKESMWREIGELRRDIEGLAQDSRADQREASERLQDAANSILDTKLEERVRYSRGLIGARDEDYIRQFESETSRAIDELQQRLRVAEQGVGESSENRQADALDRTRDLVRGLESSQRRLQELPGQPGQQTGGFSPSDVRQFRREFNERAREAAELQRYLGEEGVDTGQLDEVVRALRTLDRNGTYDDPEEIERLQSQILENLKQLEFGLRRSIEGTQDSATLSGSDDVPNGFRKLVDEYYRALSRGGGRY
jgi:Domain of unknown function (DUF4175)